MYSSKCLWTQSIVSRKLITFHSPINLKITPLAGDDYGNTLFVVSVTAFVILSVRGEMDQYSSNTIFPLVYCFPRCPFVSSVLMCKTSCLLFFVNLTPPPLNSVDLCCRRSVQYETPTALRHTSAHCRRGWWWWLRTSNCPCVCGNNTCD